MKFVKADRRGIGRAVRLLKTGGSVAYPTDTSYGLAVDATNVAAIRKLYRIKERGFDKPIHIIVPSLAYAQKVASLDARAIKIFKKFMPGPLTLVLSLKSKQRGLKLLSAGTGMIGIRMPSHPMALTLARRLKRPITTTSANPSAYLSGGYDSYSPQDVYKQFRHKKYRPDFIFDAGRLPRRRPSTVVAITAGRVTILRKGPISERAILKALAA